MITSAGNNHVRAVQALLKKRAEREKQNAFVIEGIRTLREAPRGDVRELYVTEAFLKRCADTDRRLIGSFSGAPYVVTEEVMQRLSDTMHPQGVLAVVSMPRRAPGDLLKKTGGAEPLLLVLENLQDPGNLGTILRAGEGAGITGAILAGDTADPYNPKVVRGTMGSIFRVPFARMADAAEAADALRRAGITVYAAALGPGARVYDACDYRGGTAFLIGNEGAGLSERALAAADARVTIPMAGALASLNAGVAAAILTFEAARQRRNHSPQ